MCFKRHMNCFAQIFCLKDKTIIWQINGQFVIKDNSFALKENVLSVNTNSIFLSVETYFPHETVSKKVYNKVKILELTINLVWNETNVKVSMIKSGAILMAYSKELCVTLLQVRQAGA